MQDTIIKGTGNSRTLASVPNFLTLYPSYEAFGQALINRELPIDLGPINPAGVNVKGTDLNKAALLKDTTAALYGKNAAATPDDILAAIRALIMNAQNTANSKGRIETGTVTGTTVTFSFAPFCCFLYWPYGNGQYIFEIYFSPAPGGLTITNSNSVSQNTGSTWSNSGETLNLGKEITDYKYIAFGT